MFGEASQGAQTNSDIIFARLKISSFNISFQTKQYDYEISVYLHIMCNFNNCDLAQNCDTNVTDINDSSFKWYMIH